MSELSNTQNSRSDAPARQPAVSSGPGFGASPGPRRGLPAWLLSLSLHTVLFIALILGITGARRGTGNTNDRTAGIVLVNAEAQKTEYLDEGDVTEASADSAESLNPAPQTADAQLPPELPGFEINTTQLDGTGEDLAMSLPGADSLIDGAPTSANLGGKVTTEVFGVKGTGSRFVYVFDRSASMEGYEARPLLAAKEQLLASLMSLGDTQQFQIIFYNDGTRIFNPGGGQPEIMFAEDDVKEKAERFVNSIRGDRGTDHMNALKLALQMSPDVIFLLTDAEGGLTRAELAEVARRNRSGAIINAIEFGVGSSSGNDHSLEKLAIESGGQHVYKNILTLRVEK